MQVEFPPKRMVVILNRYYSSTMPSKIAESLLKLGIHALVIREASNVNEVKIFDLDNINAPDQDTLDKVIKDLPSEDKWRWRRWL